MKTVKTAAQVRAEFSRKGISIASWARANSVSQALVHQVLGGRPCARGASHKIAVLLGMKDGEIDEQAVAANRDAMTRKRRAA